MAVTLEGGCRVSEMREGNPFVSGTLRIWNRIGRATGAQAISLRVMEFAPGASPTIVNDDCDQILYIVDGVGTACGSGRANLLIAGRTYEITPNTGIYIRPNQTFAIDNPGSESIVVITAQCPDPDRPPQFVDALDKKPIGSIASPIVGIACLSTIELAANKSRNSSARFRPAARPITFITTKKCSSFLKARAACGPARRIRRSPSARASICRRARCIVLRTRAKANCVCWEFFIRRAVLA